MNEKQEQRSQLPLPVKDLLKSDAFFRFAVEEAWQALVILDGTSKVVYANVEAERLFGRPRNKLLGREFGYPLVSQKATEIRILCGDGEVRVAHMKVGEVTAEGKTLYPIQLRDVTEVAEMQEELRSLAGEDQLTGLPNRHGFTALAEHFLRVAERLHQQLVLVCMDVDRLRATNEEFGHAQGDALLRDTAAVLKETFREADLLGRIGGDEFAILAAAASPETADTLVTRLKDAIQQFNRTTQRPCRLSLTIGTACFDSEDPIELDELIGVGGQAIHEARQNPSEG